MVERIKLAIEHAYDRIDELQIVVDMLCEEYSKLATSYETEQNLAVAYATRIAQLESLLNMLEAKREHT